MPCNNCQKIIDQFKDAQLNEELMIKRLIECENCSKEISSWCHTCGCPIYKSEPIYESSRDISSGDIHVIRFIKQLIFRIKSDNPEKVVQCGFCYRLWKNNLKNREEKLKRKELILDFLSPLSILPLLALLYPEWPKRFFNEYDWFKKLKHPYTSITFWSFLIFFVLFYWINKLTKEISEADRYKERRKINISKEIK